MAVAPQTHKVGFIGLGIMGKSMARHIMKGGYSLHVYSRTKAKCQDLVDEGAQWHDSPAGVAAAADVVITIVGYPKDVEDVYFGPDGILSTVKTGSYLIDMTTSKPTLAQKIYEAAKEKGAHALDAPVSGGDVGAREGKLAIMVGGDQDAFDTVKPLFELMGKTIALLGPAGAGQHTKMVNQIVIAGTILGVAEGLNYGKRAGLDLNKVLEVIGTGAAGGFQLNVLGKRMAEGDFAPGFFVHHFIKDMSIALEEAERLGGDYKALKTAMDQFQAFAERGGREDGTHGIFQFYERNTS